MKINAPVAARLLAVLFLAILLLASRPASSAASIHIQIDSVPDRYEAAPVEVRLAVPAHLDVETARAIRRGDVGLALVRSTAGCGALVPVDFEVEPSTPGEPVPTAIVLRWLESAAGAEYQLVTSDLRRSIRWTATDWAVRHAPRETVITLGDRPVWTAVAGFDGKDAESTFKSFDHLHGRDGARLTKGAGGLYSHHRGAFVGWSKTTHHDRVDDFWHGKDGAHYRTDRVVDAIELRPVSAVARRAARWIGANATEALRDTREVRIYDLGIGDGRIFDYTITLEATDSPVELDGDPQHAGFQFRAAEEVQESKVTYVRPPGAKDTGNDVWIDCPWVAGRFRIGAEPYLVMHADHPDNPESVYSTRDYGRFGAFFRARLEPGAPLVLRYRLVVLGGDAAERFTVGRGQALAAGFSKRVEIR